MVYDCSFFLRTEQSYTELVQLNEWAQTGVTLPRIALPNTQSLICTQP